MSVGILPVSVHSLSLLLGKMLPEPHAGLLSGLLFGTKAAIPQSLYDALVSTGTLHIIALSGQNIAILVGLLSVLLVPVFGKRVASVICLILVWSFVLFVGVSPSVVRASVMASVSLLAVVCGRQYWALGAWAGTVVGMALIHPGWVGDVSFLLSSGATLGILVFGTYNPPKRVPWYLSGILSDIHLTLSAQVFTIPILLFVFHRISLISVVSNIAIGWVIAPLMVVGWIMIGVGSVVLYGGQVVGWVAWIFLEYLIRTIQFFDRIPFASIQW